MKSSLRDCMRIRRARLPRIDCASWTTRSREAPLACAGVLPGTAPLDRYSFPSGHTLHAICMTLIATSHFPELGWLLWPFTLLVPGSRPVLGLHYPSDVAAGALLGALLAMVSQALV